MAAARTRRLVRHRRSGDEEVEDSPPSSSSSSSSDEEDEEENGTLLSPLHDESHGGNEEEGVPEACVNAGAADGSGGGERKRKSGIIISLKRVCKVCKGTGHEAGFRGATYIDCPMRPCFLCKMPGHTTMTCPHRVAAENGVVTAPRRNTHTSLDFVFERQVKQKVPKIKQEFVIPNQVDCGLIRFHSRRVTCLEFHPTRDNILLSGDKKGQVGIWDFVKLHEKTVFTSIHSCIVNNMKFDTQKDGMVYTSSSDGTVSYNDIETGLPVQLMDLNPDGWNGAATWRMVYGMDLNLEKRLLLVADNFGCLYMLDCRARARAGKSVLIHKRGTKVVGLHCNPMQQDAILSCGNDHYARIWDVRRLEPGSSLCNLAHRRVVNSAYFSPVTGTKILTTSQDNRIRVWDSIFGNLESPSREIVHSHDFNRHLTPFRAEWDPKDPSESLAVIGRYISENYNGVALHPIDFIDTSTGTLIAEVVDTDITTISPVNKLHPRVDILATGSSRSLFIWRPREDTGAEQERKPKEYIYVKPEKKSKTKFDSDSDDDLGAFGKSGKSKGKTTEKSAQAGKKTLKSH